MSFLLGANFLFFLSLGFYYYFDVCITTIHLLIKCLNIALAHIHTHSWQIKKSLFILFYIYAELDCGEKPDKKKKKHKKHHKRGHAAKRIVNGTIANPGEWPWQVLLQWENGSALLNQSFCGGAILSKHFILTAGHCIDGGRLSRVVLTASTIYSPKREKNTSLKSFCKTMDL